MSTVSSCSACCGILEPATVDYGETRLVLRCSECSLLFTTCISCGEFTAKVDGERQTCTRPSCDVHGVEFECCKRCGHWGMNIPNNELPSATRFCHNLQCSEHLQSTAGAASGPTVSESSFVAPVRGPQSDIERIDSLLNRIASQSHYEERYEVRQTLARGGMGEILDAFDQILLRPVAIKRMLRGGGKNSAPAVRGQFLKEAWIGGRLLHPNVLSVFDVGVDRDSRIYYTMRLVDGASLQESLGALQTGIATQLVRYPLRRIVRSFLGACHGIDFAHQNRILHLDLKPHNILMSGFEEVFVSRP